MWPQIAYLAVNEKLVVFMQEGFLLNLLESEKGFPEKGFVFECVCLETQHDVFITWTNYF